MKILDKPIDELVEEFFPYLPAMIVGLSFIYYFQNNSLPEKIERLVESSINIFSILIGFIGAALAIVFAIDNKPVIIKLKNDAKYHRFIRYFLEASVMSFITLAMAFVLNGLKINTFSAPWKVFISLWLTLVMSSALLSLRVIWLLFRVLYTNSQIEQSP